MLTYSIYVYVCFCILFIQIPWQTCGPLCITVEKGFINFKVFYVMYALIVVLKSWDIETNPGPVSSNLKSMSLCHWNLNSMAADNFIKLAQLEVYLSIHKHDIVCLSKTFLDSALSDDED